MKNVFIFCGIFLCSAIFAESFEYLIKFKDPQVAIKWSKRLELISEIGSLYKLSSDYPITLNRSGAVEYIVPNKKYRIPTIPGIEKIRNSPKLKYWLKNKALDEPAYPDNPEIPNPITEPTGPDPMLLQQWGIFDCGANYSYQSLKLGKDIIVAVIDTGVDYTHNDLVNNIWRNEKEIPNDGIDNDNNGYVDDIIGWDFVSNDNKPYDLSMTVYDIMFNGGNPGHGTHVSGVIAGRYNNSIGVVGVAPMAKIMALRFIGENGTGTTENAVKAIDYAVLNGAKIINASWGGEKDEEPDLPLREAIERAMKAGVIFVAAAGNGRLTGTTVSGFDNDTDPNPVVPASYDYDNMVCVAAIDAQGKLASFSNWGYKTVKIGAPGVKILSTVPGNNYQDTILDLGVLLKVTWDGTSMAAPFVSGALATLWSSYSDESMSNIRERLFQMAKVLPSLKGKVATEGKLSLN